MNNNGNTVVVYFSRTGENYAVGKTTVGSTAKVAAEIMQQTGSMGVEIVPVEPYPDAYDQAVAQATEERRNHARPAFVLDGDTAALDTAEMVFLGYPIWWSDMPMPVYTFLESRDWTGRTIVPFCTHEGSGLAGTEETLARVTGARVCDGLELRGELAQHDAASVKQAIETWLKAIV
ncbi:flavodoxin [Bifidobacterium parmae]|uniref:Flavodoxin n=1 Tax=Bifidobacterium parmae TaxID=361854 RepID=A0A2N5IWD8_9BIFI|nr:flavodoxin [Bifidobacterium parmae]PLS26261.1 flavodoxin [Bifidobacterium parmae]